MQQPALQLFLGLLLCLAGCSGAGRSASSPLPPPENRFGEMYVPMTDGVRLYVRIVGSGSDTVVIPAAVYFAHDLLPLAPGRTLIFYDPRGRGASDFVAAPERLGIPIEVEDLEALRAHLELGRFSLVGWSYLGAVVALYAAEHPDRVKRVVQIGPFAPRTASSMVSQHRGRAPDAADVQYLSALRAEGRSVADPIGYCREWLQRQMLRSALYRWEGIARTRMDPCIHWNEWPDQMRRTVRMVIPQQWDYSDRARRVRAPVLTIHGNQDRNAPIEGGRDWVSLLPNARLLELEDVGHAPWLEAPSEFFSAVDSFLRDD